MRVLAGRRERSSLALASVPLRIHVEALLAMRAAEVHRGAVVDAVVRRLLAVYGHAAVTGRYRTCESEVVAMLSDLLRKQLDYAAHDGVDFLDAIQNKRAMIPNLQHGQRVQFLLAAMRQSHDTGQWVNT